MIGKIITKSNLFKYLSPKHSGIDNIITFSECKNIFGTSGPKKGGIREIYSHLVIFDKCDKDFTNVLATPEILPNTRVLIFNQSPIGCDVPWRFLDCDNMRIYISVEEFNKFYDQLDENKKSNITSKIIQSRIVTFSVDSESPLLNYHLDNVVS